MSARQLVISQVFQSLSGLTLGLNGEGKLGTGRRDESFNPFQG